MRMNTTLLLVSVAVLACGGGEESASSSSSSRPNSQPASNTISGGGSSASPDLEEDEGEVIATVGDVTITEREFQVAASRRAVCGFFWTQQMHLRRS